MKNVAEEGSSKYNLETKCSENINVAQNSISPIQCTDEGLKTVPECANLGLEGLLKHAFELGAQKAKIIDAKSVVVEEWVRWKCQYGCNLYGKDAIHAPCAPNVESTTKVLKEYTKAILLNAADRNKLTDAAIKLEALSYHNGYYKAFALVASAPGSSCCSSDVETQNQVDSCQGVVNKVRPLMEACGIDVFRTARANGFSIDTKKDTYGQWNYFSLVLLE